METILFEKEVLQFLNIPSIPLKKHDGKTSFKFGVAVVNMMTGVKAYAAATFDAEKDKEPRIRKVFTQELFRNIEEIFVVPSYMDTDVENADLDKESKEAAQRLAEEAHELENQGVESEGMKEMKSLPEWVFDNVHNEEEAIAYIKQYNKRNKIKGNRIPKGEENLKIRLLAIYKETNKKTK